MERKEIWGNKYTPTNTPDLNDRKVNRIWGEKRSTNREGETKEQDNANHRGRMGKDKRFWEKTKKLNHDEAIHDPTEAITK